MDRSSRLTGAPLGLLLVALVLLLPGTVALSPASPRVAAPALPALIPHHGIRPILRSILPSGIVISTVDYSSSVDSFPLSYSEVLPAGFVPSDSYPLLVELHGIAVTNSVPKDGGYPTPLDNLTMNDTSAMGFILIVPNTRTGDGFYIDSTYTGPQAQDIQDAITTEKELRQIGSVYLYGFSMGSMGTLSIGLQHPTEFAGLGSVATFSDIYELYDYQAAHDSVPLNDALLNLTGGLLPNASAYAVQIFNELTELRMHPELTRGIRMYLTSGGRDSLAVDTPALWPYLEGNDSTVQTTCLVATDIDEPANCTLPLAALNAADPANYSYRFVYEPDGVHAYEQVNVTDMLKFFLGEVPSGNYVGTFPTPTVTAPPVPEITLVTFPYDCGTIAINGVAFPDGNTLTLAPGNYAVAADACPGYSFTGFVERGGISYDASTANVTISGTGALVAEFAAPSSPPNASARYQVTVSAADGCPPVELNGSAESDGTSVVLAPGEYVAEAGACAGWTFASWTATGGVTVWSPSDSVTGLQLSANGTLGANYVPAPTDHPILVYVSPAACGPADLDGSAIANGSSLSLPVGSYPLVAPACDGYRFATWVLSGALSGGGAGSTATLTVSGTGTVTAVYAVAGSGTYQLSVQITPASCGAVAGVGGALYASGSIALLLPGSYSLSAASCPGYEFETWAVTGEATVATGSITIAGNATLSAGYQFIGSTRGVGGSGSNSTPAPSLLSTWGLTLLGLAAGLVVGGVVGVLLARSRRQELSPPRADDDGEFPPME